MVLKKPGFKLPFFFTSKYDQRMRKLSCKIFNDFYIPELPKKDLDYSHHHQPVRQWAAKWHNDMRVWERNQEQPFDLNEAKNAKYYPAHPQLRQLTHVLREYGLFRDEHRDFNEAMKEVAISRGKVYRERRGPHNKGGAKESK